ncbi:hypothetical protein Tco_0015567 [Tanacetum coccineum]
MLIALSSLLYRENLPDVKDAFASISREESHRGIASSSSGFVSKPHISGFVSKTNNWTNNGNKRVDNTKFNNDGNNSGNNRGPNPNLICKNYGKVGHTVGRCFDLIGYPLGYNKSIALGWHLEEIHVTWAHLGKKRTRLQLYTKVEEEKSTQTLETASQ